MPSKPSPEARKRDYCDHAITAIDSILDYIKGMDFKAYDRDRKTVSAVERELLTVAEVIGRLADFDATYAQWYQVRGLANRLRHEYDDTDNLTIWELIAGPQLLQLRDAFVTFA